MVFQKYFDQWDFADKLLGERMLSIELNNWNAAKVGLYIGEEPTAEFYSKVFSKCQVIVEESDLTPTQQNLQAQQMMDMNAQFGREVFSPSQIIPKLNITGKAEIIQILEQQEQQQAQMQQEQQNLAHAFENAKLQELMSKSTLNVATATERYSRKDSNEGLFEERLSMISKNRASSMKDKVAALKELVEVMNNYHGLDVAMEKYDLERMERQYIENENAEKADAKRTSAGNEFMQQLLGQQSSINQLQPMM